jgi:peroxiredoxin
VQVPGYLENQDSLKAAGISEVIIYCVNDGAVMTAWGKDQGIEGSMITFMGDPSSDLTVALDMMLTHEGPRGVGLFNRCKRNAVYLVDGVVKSHVISEKLNDPAGDDFPEDTCAPAMLTTIKGLKTEL